jgi:hypothetical protein
MFLIKEGITENFGKGTDDKTKKSIISWLEKEGLTVRTSEQDETFIKSKVQSEVDKAYSGFATDFEKVIKETTGVEKNPSEKATDYATRAVGDKLKGVTELQTKIKEYEEKGVEGNKVAENLKQQLEQVQGELKSANEAKVKLEADHKKQIFEGRLKGEIDGVIANIKPTFKKDLTPGLVDDILTAKLAKFNSEVKAEQVENTIVYKDGEGNIILNTKDGTPKSLNSIMTGYFGEYIDEGRKQGGAGSGGKDGAGGAGGGSEALSKLKNPIPETVKSKDALMNHLRDVEKMDTTTKEFSEAFNEAGKDLPLTDQ